jgi:hypothetical protein
MTFYNEGSRKLQDLFDGRRLADSLELNRRHDVFTCNDRKLIESAPFFFLATSSADNVDCSFKGGAPGFIKITGPNSFSYPDYDGNSMYRSLGNIIKNKNVGLLFINFNGSQERMRINGHAILNYEAKRIKEFEGAKLIIDITAINIFPNCPRYIPELNELKISEDVPRSNHTPPDPEWKFRDYAKPYLPKADQKRLFENDN